MLLSGCVESARDRIVSDLSTRDSTRAASAYDELEQYLKFDTFVEPVLVTRERKAAWFTLLSVEAWRRFAEGDSTGAAWMMGRASGYLTSLSDTARMEQIYRYADTLTDAALASKDPAEQAQFFVWARAVIIENEMSVYAQGDSALIAALERTRIRLRDGYRRAHPDVQSKAKRFGFIMPIGLGAASAGVAGMLSLGLFLGTLLRRRRTLIRTTSGPKFIHLPLTH